MRDYLMGQFNGGCTARRWLWEQPLLAAILQEANDQVKLRGRLGGRHTAKRPNAGPVNFNGWLDWAPDNFLFPDQHINNPAAGQERP